MQKPLRVTLVTTIPVGEVLVVTGVTPPDGLLAKAMSPVGFFLNTTDLYPSGLKLQR